MLPKVAHISDPMPATDLRGAPRRVVKFGFELAGTGGASRILVLNLSRTGMLLQTSADLAIGEGLALEIPEAGLIEAQIVRKSDDQFGAVFLKPISQAAVSAVLLAAPVRPAPVRPAAVDEAPALVPAPGPRRANEFNSVSEWLLWGVLAATALVAAAFVYALSFLLVTG